MSFDFFPVQVRRVTDLTPSFRRFTFAGESLDRWANPGWDQRIKVVLPLPGCRLDEFPRGEDWYLRWRDLPPGRKHPFRTYTVRGVREGEVDIDMVVHEVDGPASAWIAAAGVGDEVVLLGPTTDSAADYGGVDFLPPARTENYLLAGDETAAPAIAVILEQLPAEATGIAVLELPGTPDIGYLPRHPGIEVRVFPRRGAARGEALVREGNRAADELVPAGVAHAVEEVDVDRDILWEAPRSARGGAVLRSTPLYAWLAGEAGAIKALRRHLVGDLGLDRRTVAFMGYWRLGRPEM
ncbi:MAG: siderophore-interacting protein [Propionicimonas sp.]|nr:siderophore-interacting protein [Propionicimonas sp.]